MAGKNTFYITTPIYYVNAKPHLGHVYTTALADTLTRFYRMRGFDSFFLTGTDEHGEKIQQAAEKRGITPLDLTTEVSNEFRQLWDAMGFKYSHFIRTTDAPHKKIVQDILAKLFEQGDIYKGEYGGNYCVGCERFLTDKELIDGNCPDHQTPPQYVKEQNYFFRMSKYQQQLIDHLNTHPDFIRPERYRNEVLAMLREPLEDLCISRPKSRISWGIELPFDNDYVTYVWFDALVNYLSALDYPSGAQYKKYWPVVQHITAKDILKPHGVFWPTMLMAMGVPLYQHLNVHGYWTTPTGKMSKSLGNVVDPIQIWKEYGMDAFRYFFFREMTFGIDASFAIENLEGRFNADLANNLGNLVSRALAMVHKYRNGAVPAAGPESELDRELRERAEQTAGDLVKHMEAMEISRALEKVWGLIDAANVFIDRSKPWVLAKAEKTDPQAKAQLDTSLAYQVEVIRVVAVMISPFMPDTAAKIFSFLHCAPESKARTEFAAWGLVPPGTVVEKGEALFPRREKKEEAKPAEAAAPKAPGEKAAGAKPAAEPAAPGIISYDEFAKVKLRVGQVLTAERVAKSDKLLKLSVDIGDPEGPRQILAGIGKFYEPEILVGRKVAVVANLKPAKLMGLESRGMLLAAADASGTVELVSVGATMAPGTEIR